MESPAPIKLCPHCGGDADLWHAKGGLGSYISCSVCGARTRLFQNDNAAVEAWNCRFAADGIGAVVTPDKIFFKGGSQPA